MRASSKVSGLLVGMALLSGGAIGASAHAPTLMAGATYAAQAPVAALQAAPGQDPRCAADQANDAAEGDQGAEQENANDTDNVQDESSADSANESESTKEDTADTDNLQCGDQNEDQDAANSAASQASQASIVNGGKASFLSSSLSQGATAPRAAHAQEADNTDQETEGAEKSESGTDHETDGIACEQQGENEGDNAGC